jgi:pimeloyl-ACP methyl ester carboxylesterase
MMDVRFAWFAFLVSCQTASSPTPTPAQTQTPTLTQDAAVAEPIEAGRAQRENIGPHEAVMLPGRNVWWALAHYEDEHRLVAGMHGQCGGPSYACGSWIDAGTERGFMVCPTGNEHCTSDIGPPSWDESFTLMDQDLELSIKIAQKKTDAGFDREGSVLVGFSRGGWAAIDLVRRHPGRWPYLILIEADVTINKAYLEASKVHAVAMIAGELGTELPGEQKSVDAMKAAGYPAQLFIMPKTAHLYSTNIDEIMRNALDFVLAH